VTIVGGYEVARDRDHLSLACFALLALAVALVSGPVDRVVITRKDDHVSVSLQSDRVATG
jgi:hypothetical protein